MSTPEPTTVFVVQRHVPYEGSSIVGVFTDPEIAREHRDRETAAYHDSGADDIWCSVQAWTGPGPVLERRVSPV